MAINDAIEVSGPLGNIKYLDNGKLLFGNKKTSNYQQYDFINLFCAGSGITPMNQLLGAIKQEYASENENIPKCRLFNYNKNRNDILCRKEL